MRSSLVKTPLDYQLNCAFCSPAEKRKAAGVIIDLDKAVYLNDNEAPDKELKERMVSCGLAESAGLGLTSCTSCMQGTPTYVARSVAAGTFDISVTSLFSAQMTILQGEVKQRYEERHADNPRYELYNDTGGTSHGGTSAMEQGYGIDDTLKDMPTFFHRPEHDVESIYWSMVSVLLRVRPTTFPKSEYAEGILEDAFAALDTHQIYDDVGRNDTRQSIQTISSANG